MGKNVSLYSRNKLDCSAAHLALSQRSRVPCLFAYQCCLDWQMPMQFEEGRRMTGRLPGSVWDWCHCRTHSLVGMRSTKAFNNLNVPLLQESGARQHLMRDCFVTKSSTSSGLVSSLTWLQQIKKAHSEDSHDSLLNGVRALLLPLWWSISKQQCKHHKAGQVSDCSTKVCFPLGIMPPVDIGFFLLRFLSTI